MPEKDSANYVDWCVSRGISYDSAQRCGLFFTDNAQRDVHPSLRPDTFGVVLPYFDESGAAITEPDGVPFRRIRVLNDPKAAGFSGPVKQAKYLQGPGTAVYAYLPPMVNWRAIFRDTSIPIIITEGEAKTIALCQNGFPAIGLGGVDGFMARKKLLDELERVDWQRRDVFVCFDSDVVFNPNVRLAESKLIRELSTRRLAECHIVRIPPEDAGVDHEGRKLPAIKLGADDFLVKYGPAAFRALVDSAPTLSALDRGVEELNSEIAWIESEGKVFEFATGNAIHKSDLVKGSKYASRKVLRPGQGKNAAPKSTSVAEVWLTHENHMVLNDVVFDPSTTAYVVDSPCGPALNLWRGYDAAPGNVQPFIDLSDHMFSRLPDDLRYFAIYLLAYKAQNPSYKGNIAVVFTGDQGSGKSLWCHSIVQAFGRYGQTIDARSLLSAFNGFVEQNLVVFIDEAKDAVLYQAREVLKNLITQQTAYMNEKHRKAKDVKSFACYLLAANDRAVGSFEHDDRRMFIIPAPGKREKNFYVEIANWLRRDGPRHLMHYLLNFPLNGWSPPQDAPLTHEKHVAYHEGLTIESQVAAKMRTADENTVKLWLLDSLSWSQQNIGNSNPMIAKRASDIQQLLPHYHIRDWYTPEELCLIFPAIAEQLHGYRGSKIRSTTPGVLSRALRNNGIPLLIPADRSTMGFRYKGNLHQFLVVANPEKWQKPLTQREFEYHMSQWRSFRGN